MPRMIIAATIPIAAGIRICKLLWRIVTCSVWLTRGPLYCGEEKLMEYCPGEDGALNVNVTSWLAPGEIVIPVCSATFPDPWRIRSTVIISVIFVALLFRCRVVVTVCP